MAAGREEDRKKEYEKVLAGSPRLLQAVRRGAPAETGTAALVYSHVLAPGLGAFVEWLLRKALNSKKQRLYFLARDGYFMYRAALILCEAYHLPLDCRYLSCSRYSLRLPLFHLNREGALEHVCRSGVDVTPWKILGRAGLTDNQRQEVLSILSLPLRPDEPVPYAALPDIRRRLAECPLFLTYMERHSQDAMPGLSGYLRQEGLLDAVPYAVVDSGWTGSIQKTLGDALAVLGCSQRPEGYYWGLYELPPGVKREEYHGYYFEPKGQLREKIYFNNSLFEALYTAPHGMTLGYFREGERYIPRYGFMAEPRKAWIRRNGELLLSYVRQLTILSGSAGLAAGNGQAEKNTIKRLFRLFMAAPSRQEAEIFGSLPFSVDVLEGQEQPLAAPLTEEELKANHALPRLLTMAGIRRGHIRESAWYEGSAILYGANAGQHLRQYALYQALRFARKSVRFYRKR